MRKDAGPRPIRSLTLDYSMESVYVRYVTPDGERHQIEVYDPDTLRVTGRRVLIGLYGITDEGSTTLLFTQEDGA